MIVFKDREREREIERERERERESFLLTILYSFLANSRYCVMKLTERLKKEGIDINLRDALGVDTDPKLRNLRGKL